jgi:hypothetical protein
VGLLWDWIGGRSIIRKTIVDGGAMVKATTPICD